MSYIYKITNLANGKMYVGNTSFDIQKRWKEHCKDSQRQRCKNRPLYRAMNEYGIENFEIKALEECSDLVSEEREVFWINKLKTYENGYNDTSGGAGKPQVDYDLVVSVYKSTRNKRETARIIGISNNSVYKILKKMSVDTYPKEDTAFMYMKPLKMYDNHGNVIAGFISAKNAAKWMCEQKQYNELNQDTVRKNIQKACVGKHKKAYGYVWMYI